MTGANGLIGAALLEQLQRNLIPSKAALRTGCTKRLEGNCVEVGSIDSGTQWKPVLQDVETVVHLAARVHVMRDTAVNPMDEFRRVNVEGTLNLARKSADAGVRRLVFLSSIKVNGEETSTGKQFRPDDILAPMDAYSISKWEAEQGLLAIAKETGMEIVIIRPPLVYGPGVKGNFLSMMRWLAHGVPLPLGAINNRRSLVSLDNLVDLIMTCLDHPAAANQTFLVSDDKDVSTTELLQRIGNALDKPARLIPVPPKLLQWGANLFGKEDIAQRLLGNLQLDISKTKEYLGWTPPINIDVSLKKTAEWYWKQR